MEKLRIGMVGCGLMMKSHLESFQLLDNVEVTALCDLNQENMDVMLDALNDPYMTTNYETMVDYVDAVLIALPHHLHYECGIYFARHGKHILMEKPLCNTEEECLRLIEVCEENNLTLMCGYPIRYWPAVLEMKRMVDSGEYGNIVSMSAWVEQLTGPSHPETDWRLTGNLGGGQLFSHGCHYIDLLLMFLGNPVSGVHFGNKIGTPWMLKEGTSAVLMKFENDTIGYHFGTWGSRGSKQGHDFQIMTDKCLIDYAKHIGEIRVYDNAVEHIPGAMDHYYKNYTVVWKREGPLTKATEFEIAHFVDCIRTGKRPVTDGRTALQSLRVIWKLYDAEKYGFIADLRDCKVPVDNGER